MIDQRPDSALRLLDTEILEKNLDRDDYYRYILLYTRVRDRNDIDIKNETLVFQARDYYLNKKDYFFNNQVSLKEFKLLKINRSRFELLFHILKQIKETNTDFGIEYNKFMLEIEREITYKFKKETIRRVENYFNKNMKFNMISSVLIEELEGLIK